MDAQSIINLAFGCVGTLFGWILKVVWDSVTSLQSETKQIMKDLHSEYVRKDEFRDALSELREEMRETRSVLTRIFDKLENKADRL